MHDLAMLGSVHSYAPFSLDMRMYVVKSGLDLNWTVAEFINLFVCNIANLKVRKIYISNYISYM